jgi:predicted ATPase
VVAADSVDTRIPFVGRDDELRRLLRFFDEGGALTLVGPGGVGKTRLVYEAATQFDAQSARPTAFISLAGVPPEAVVGTALTRLGLHEEPGRPPIDSLHSYLSVHPMTIVLDNCEHAPDETSAMIDKLREIPGLAIVATSQRRLDYGGETVLEIAPFALEEGTAFFAARAGLDVRTFDEHRRETVETIVARLDGLAVALDLAAARLTSLSLEELAAQLADLKPYQLRSTRGLDPRHRTIGNVIAWSLTRVSDTAKATFSAVSLYSDIFTAADAAALLDVDETLAAAALEELLHDSLVMRTELGYRMLRPIAAVALRTLTTGPQRRALDDRFAMRIDTIAKELFTELRDPNRAGFVITRLLARYADFCTAISWSLKRPVERVEAIANVISAALIVWADNGRFTEGLRWTERLESVAERLRPELRGQIYYTGLCVAHAASQYRRMVEIGPSTISAFTIAGDRLGLARAYNALSAAALNTGNVDDAATYAETALRLYENIGHERGIGTALINHGNILLDGFDDSARAKETFREAAAMLDRIGAHTLAGIAFGNLAEVEYFTGEYDISDDHAAMAIDRFERTANIASIAWQYETLARNALARLRLPDAGDRLRTAHELLRRAPQTLFVARLWELCARASIAQGDFASAAIALAVAKRLRAEHFLISMGFIAREVTQDEELVTQQLERTVLEDAKRQAVTAGPDARDALLAGFLGGIGRSEPRRTPDIVSEHLPT